MPAKVGAEEAGVVDRKAAAGPDLVDGDEGKKARIGMREAFGAAWIGRPEGFPNRTEKKGTLGEVEIPHQKGGQIGFFHEQGHCFPEGVLPMQEGIGILVVEGDANRFGGLGELDGHGGEGRPALADNREPALDGTAAMEDDHGIIEQLHCVVGKQLAMDPLLASNVDVALDHPDNIGLKVAKKGEGLVDGGVVIMVGSPEDNSALLLQREIDGTAGE